MKPITPLRHGLVDYVAFAAMVILPGLLRLPPQARTASYTLAGINLLVDVLTDYPLAVRRLIPFPVHGTVELASGPAFLAIPALLGGLKTSTSRNYFLGLLGMVVLANRLTDWKASAHT